jgi:peptidoglycan/LPS O-acetylase OafA/YrhL
LRRIRIRSASRSTRAGAFAVTGYFGAWRHLGAAFDPRRPNNFDLLRFVAATLVLVDHCYVLSGRPGLPGPFGYETWGGFAVAVFFVISGFLVAASWERAPRLGAFAVKRALRIVPAYAVVVALAALVLGPVVTDFPLGQYFRHAQTWAYFRNLTFVQMHFSLPGVFTANPYPYAVNGSIWTLPIEVTMYVVLALLGRIGLMTRAAVTALVALLAIGWFVGGPALWRARPLLLEVLPAAYTVHLALWFFAGSALWVWRERVRYRSDVAIVLLVLLWFTRGTPVSMLLFHAALPYLIFWIAQLRVAAMNRFGRFGDFSYGMYLYAFPVQQTLTFYGGAAWPHLGYIAGCFVVTLLFAVASWHTVEHPALRLKARRSLPAAGEPPGLNLMERKAADPARP